MIEATPATGIKGFLLDGEWRTDGAEMEVHAPSDQRLVATIARARREHVEAAIEAAVQAFEVTRKLGAYERQRALREVAAGLGYRREEFARTLALEAGKPVKSARAEVDRAIFTFTIAAEESS